ncbi:hypothetical protein ACFV0R_01695 [Streptomyces sp. NPDC059578]|uniref:hypothetical protein n=1 Tax=Streptomyces sp. NPDC059578 TaxID=3346874 RepID=UPI0036BD9644
MLSAAPYHRVPLRADPPTVRTTTYLTGGGLHGRGSAARAVRELLAVRGPRGRSDPRPS